MSIFIANSREQNLMHHSIGVCKRTLEIIDSYNIKNDIPDHIKNKIYVSAFYASLFHDIGKVDHNFQNYIREKKLKEKESLEENLFDAEKLRHEFSKKEKFKGPYHNEISFYFSSKKLSFKEEIYHDVINYAIYWHHPANIDDNSKFCFDSSDQISDHINDEVKNEIEKFSNDLLNLIQTTDFIHKYSHFNFFKIEKRSQRNCRPHFVDIKETNSSKRAIKRLVLFTLMQADREISALTQEQLILFIEDKLPLFKYEKNYSKFKLNDILESDKRSLEQLNVAKKLSCSKISICAVDPGAGKTSISLLWHALNQNEQKRKLYIALPRQFQVTGLFYTIKEDLNRLCQNAETVSIEAVFNGNRQYAENTENGLLNSQINILVFDRLLSPCYERDQFSEFVSVLNSDLVIDEFHEFSWLYSMIEPLSEIITIRKWLNNGAKTIFLSGTPDPALIKKLNLNSEDIEFIRRDALSPVSESQTYVVYQENETFDRKEDTLISFNKVDDCQKIIYEQNIEDFLCVHSKFTDEDKRKRLENVLNEYGKNSKSKKTTTTAKILQSSFNLNYRNAYLAVSHPNTDAQTWGRINRYGNKPDGYIVMFPEKDMSIFDKNKMGYKELIISWNLFLKEKLSNNQSFNTRRMLSDLYDNFFSSHENISKAYKYLEEKSNEDFQKLEDWFPVRDYKKKSKTIADKFVSKKSSKHRFRGITRYVSAMYMDQLGEPKGMLTGEHLLSISSNWEMIELKKATDQVVQKCISDFKKLDVQDFSYNKYMKNFGIKPEAPLLTSFYYNSSFDSAHKRLLSDLEEKNLYRVYHPLFGLIRYDIFEELKKKFLQVIS